MAADHPQGSHNNATNSNHQDHRSEDDESNGHIDTNGLDHPSNDNAIQTNGTTHNGSNDSVRDESKKNHTNSQQTRPMANRPRLLSIEEIKETNDSLLPLDRFSEWIYCIALVTFDIEVGQAIEKIYPPHIRLTERERSNVCYLAFPDSNSGCMGNTQFHFRTRLCPIRKKSIGVHKSYNRLCAPSLEADATHFYGFVYFRQVRDRSARRGYFQKSLVLLTRLPFLNLFNQLVSILAPEFFDRGESDNFIQAACSAIDHWPAPIPGSTLSLPFMGHVFQIHIPSRNDKLNHSPQAEVSPSTNSAPTSNESSAPDSIRTSTKGNNLILIPSIHEPKLYSLVSMIKEVQLLWELVLVNEPLVVMAPTPDLAAQVVQCLVSLIWPLKYASDFRPFFTIHDSEFKEYTTKSQSPPNVILGVTNPFFSKTLNHWPHIIKIGEYQPSTPTRIRAKLPSNRTLDWKPGLFTKYKPFLQKDKTIIKKIQKGLESRRPDYVQNALMRKYLLELTQSFLIPLERYLASLMPFQKNISPFKGTPLMQPFNPEDFLKTLETTGPQLTCGIKGDWQGLYRRFFKSPNFNAWFDERYKEVSRTLKVLHIEAMSRANLAEWTNGRAEVEVVDLVLRLKEKLKTVEGDALPVTNEAQERLRNHLDDIIDALPPDLQNILRKADVHPSRPGYYHQGLSTTCWSNTTDDVEGHSVLNANH